MQISISNTHQSSGLSKVCDFRIETNGVMIKALTSRLYSDPIRSIVRELASNALDACPTRPMDITIPTALRPAFIVRDYGPGLSPEAMVEVFTRFGASTKRADNTQIGGFGLGAKSPFAIVNSYNITSHHEGTKSTYIASIESDGMPSLHLISATPTNETGLEISVPASSSQHSTWFAALSQLRFFEPRPNISEPMEWPSILHEDPDFLVVAGRDPQVLVGPVAYPLDIYKVTCRFPFALRMPIGSIEVTASREEIVYSPSTIATLQSLVSKAEAAYTSAISKVCASAATLPEVWRLTKGMPLGSIPWRGYSVRPDSLWISGTDALTYCTIDQRHRRRRKRWLFTFGESVTLTRDALVYIADDTRKMQDRILAHCPDPGNANIIVAKDPSFFDNVGYPYTRISTLPMIGQSRGPAVRLRYREVMPDDKVRTTSATYSHYITLTSDNYIIIDRWRIKFTHELCTAMCKRLGILGIYIVYADKKTKVDGLTDVLPLWQNTVAPLLAAARRTHTYDSLLATIGKGSSRWQILKALSALGLLDLDFSIVPSLSRNRDLVLMHMLEADEDYDALIKRATAKHPLVASFIDLVVNGHGNQYSAYLSLISTLMQE